MTCETSYCRNQRAPKRRVCHKCHSRKYRENNKMMAAFHICKANATRRGKEWSLTFEQFKEFAIRTDYLIGKGRTKEGYTIDRKREEYGYHAWNIQVLTNSENVAKSNRYRRQLKWLLNENDVPYHFRFIPEAIPQPIKDCPF